MECSKYVCIFGLQTCKMDVLRSKDNENTDRKNTCFIACFGNASLWRDGGSSTMGVIFSPFYLRTLKIASQRWIGAIDPNCKYLVSIWTWFHSIVKRSTWRIFGILSPPVIAEMTYENGKYSRLWSCDLRLQICVCVPLANIYIREEALLYSQYPLS